MGVISIDVYRKSFIEIPSLPNDFDCGDFTRLVSYDGGKMAMLIRYYQFNSLVKIDVDVDLYEDWINLVDGNDDFFEFGRVFPTEKLNIIHLINDSIRKYNRDLIISNIIT